VLLRDDNLRHENNEKKGNNSLFSRWSWFFA
jgi:hypothetical protein